MKMMGVRELVSGKTSSRVHGGASVNALPSSTPTYCCADATAFSSLNTFTMASLIKGETFSCQPPGSAVSKGNSDSAHCLKSSEASFMPSVNPSSEDCKLVSRYLTFFHCESLSQSTAFSPGSNVRGLPRRKTFHSRDPMVSHARRMDVHSRKLNNSLCSSNSPRHTLLNMNCVVKSIKFLRRCSRWSDLSELSMHVLKSFMKKVREYWYMGPMRARSATTK
mmetsp:Transcript_13323/g.21655  ORF Transcript_13323/g.21655 Transcript_13323/m.21655 type:complete len:222 (-) Transcript_13323:1141-1806(-)